LTKCTILIEIIIFWLYEVQISLDWPSIFIFSRCCHRKFDFFMYLAIELTGIVIFVQNLVNLWNFIFDQNLPHFPNYALMLCVGLRALQSLLLQKSGLYQNLAGCLCLLVSFTRLFRIHYQKKKMFWRKGLILRKYSALFFAFRLNINGSLCSKAM
jgi:hypothetical protein